MNISEEQTLSQLEKMQFVEHLAYFHGTVNREDLINRFGISKASATNLLSAYNRMAPENLSYNIQQKCYEIGRSFQPVFNVRSLSERIPVYRMPKLHKPDDDDSIRKIAVISRAIQKSHPLTITYASASSGKSRRHIVPVAFADNLLRWHLRAYDRKRQGFIDFDFERIFEVHEMQDNSVREYEHPKNDNKWHTFIDLKLKVHPHNIVDAQSFSRGNEMHHIKIRAALAGYFLQIWNVDCTKESRLRGKQYQYVLANLKKVSKMADLELAPGYCE